MTQKGRGETKQSAWCEITEFLGLHDTQNTFGSSIFLPGILIGHIKKSRFGKAEILFFHSESLKEFWLHVYTSIFPLHGAFGFSNTQFLQEKCTKLQLRPEC